MTNYNYGESYQELFGSFSNFLNLPRIFSDGLPFEEVWDKLKLSTLISLIKNLIFFHESFHQKYLSMAQIYAWKTSGVVLGQK